MGEDVSENIKPQIQDETAIYVADNNPLMYVAIIAAALLATLLVRRARDARR